jgi:hypothetical protein
MKMHFRLILLMLFVFIITSCENLQKKVYFYADVDFDLRLSVGTKIYYGEFLFVV